MLNNQRIEYETVETYPLHPSEYSRLNYGDHLHPATLQQYLLLLHEGSWGKTEAVHPLMTFLKREESLLNYVSTKPFHLIYFDAFAPALQPELWTQQVFEKMHAMLESNGLLLTYCSKGAVRRAMQSAGFSVQKLPGPPHKREIIRAIKK
jgi:tRNA U34 5-methylaminomethyl-2-thiouridine-forming methyltransferase MnmC